MPTTKMLQVPVEEIDRPVILLSAYMQMLDEMPKGSPSKESLWAHRFMRQREEVSRRAAFFIFREVVDLRRLLKFEGMVSTFDLLDEDRNGQPSARLSIHLGDPQFGTTTYEYVVYAVEGGYWTPRFTVPELIRYWSKRNSL